MSSSEEDARPALRLLRLWLWPWWQCPRDEEHKNNDNGLTATERIRIKSRQVRRLQAARLPAARLVD